MSCGSSRLKLARTVALIAEGMGVIRWLIMDTRSVRYSPFSAFREGIESAKNCLNGIYRAKGDSLEQYMHTPMDSHPKVSKNDQRI